MTMLAARPRAAKFNTRPIVGHKTFPLQDVAVDVTGNGTLSGYGAVFGNRDDGGDIIEPGFFDDVLPDFLHEGMLAWNHDWGSPVAMPKAATEDAVGLAMVAEFHSTAAAQEKRTIAAERLAAGLTMGLSIGYEIAPGGAVLKQDGRHLLKASRLFEVSLVMVPMNREAGVTDVKTLAKPGQKSAIDNVRTADYVLEQVLSLINAELEDFDGDAAEDVTTLSEARDLITTYIAATAKEVGTPDDLDDIADDEAAAQDVFDDWMYMSRTAPIAQHAERVTRAVKGLDKRVNVYRLRVKEGRVLSSSNVERLQGHIDTLSALVNDMKDLIASATAEKGSAKRTSSTDWVAAARARLALEALNHDINLEVSTNG
jgi:HK97 family phage prohead protease